MASTVKCIIILSSKSAGSSALQEMICRFAGGKHVAYTRHREHETLYWTKAASILGLPQIKLPDSEVPIAPAKAERELREFLKANVPGIHVDTDPIRLTVDGWRALTLQNGPVFVEKSPHHLHQWSCLELMAQTAERLPEIDFRFVGLVRNPMDVLYSAWTRWRILPEVMEWFWKTAYENLERFRAIIGKRLAVVRYEDFSALSGTAESLLRDLGLTINDEGVENFIHGASRMKWKRDVKFGFQLNPEVASVAERFGYEDSELENLSRGGWRARSLVSRWHYRTFRLPVIRARQLLRGLK